MHRIAQNASLNLFAALVNLLTGIGISVLAARVLGAHEYGVFSFAVWLLTTSVWLLDPGGYSILAKFTSQLAGARQKEVANTLFIGLLLIQGIIGLSSLILIIIFRTYLAKFLGTNGIQPILIIISIGMPVYLVFNVLRGRLAGLQQYNLMSLVTIIASLLSFALISVMLNRGFRTTYLLMSTIGIVLFQLVVFALLIVKLGKVWLFSPIPRLLMGQVLRYSAGIFFILKIDIIIWQRSETYFLGRYSTPEQIGYYNLAFNIANILVMTMPLSLIAVLLPALSNKYGAGENNAIQSIYATATKMISFFCLPAGLGCMAIAKSMIQLFYGVTYNPAVPILQLLLISCIISSVAGPGSSLLYAINKPYIAVFWGIPIAILDLMLAYIFVRSYGAIGAAIANIVCQILASVVCTLYLIKYEGFKLPFISIIKTATVSVIAAFVAFSFTSIFNNWMGLFLGVIFAILVYIAGMIIFRVIAPSDFSFVHSFVNKIPGGPGAIIRYSLLSVVNWGKK